MSVPSVGVRRLASANPTEIVVVLGDEGDLGREDLGHLGELLLLVRRPLVDRRRHLVVEVSPERRDRLVVLRSSAAHVHPVILAPASRNWADRFSNGAKRSPIARTSSMDKGRPAA